jgi:hypothetical protein
MEVLAGVAKRLDRDYFVRQGRKGGKKGGAKGGKATADKRTAQERSDAARKAVLARWKKFYETTKGRKRD